MQQQQAAARASERAAIASEDARWARRAPLTAPVLPSRHASSGQGAAAPTAASLVQPDICHKVTPSFRKWRLWGGHACSLPAGGAPHALSKDAL